MISLPILLAGLGCAIAFQFTPVYEWKHIHYYWKSQCEQKLANATGLYSFTNLLLYDAEWHTDGKLFVTTPRIHYTNPASLSAIFEGSTDHGEQFLHPYPSPEWHVMRNCSGITNALKVVIDKCDNMWIVDSGIINYEVICPAQIHKIDVNTGRLVMQYKIPDEVSKRGLLGTHAVRTEGANCEKILVIAADLRGKGYVIFDGSTSWRLDNDIFEPDANFTNMPVDKWVSNLVHGPLGFTIVDEKFAHTEFGLMWSFTGNRAFGLSIQDLINSRDSQENLKWYKSEYTFSSPATAAVISKQGILFSAFVGRQKLKCTWLGNPIVLENVDVLVEESELLLEITSMKTTTDAHGNEYLRLVTNNYPRWKAGIPNLEEVNAGIYIANIADLTNGTRCQPKGHFVRGKSWAEMGFTPLKNHNGLDI